MTFLRGDDGICDLDPRLRGDDGSSGDSGVRRHGGIPLRVADVAHAAHGASRIDAARMQYRAGAVNGCVGGRQQQPERAGHGSADEAARSA
ncbi:hypothetical protein [Metallibacterium scheffleri]|uniref:hypothetical protein n=1 Tax=Metallibacterium scheffleri TaxID=993689 RepID=UPI0023F3292C|nr:hypothetical protein [Metallibacterium scheffleri]